MFLSVCACSFLSVHRSLTLQFKMLLTLTVELCQKKTRGHNNSTTKFGQLRNTFEPQRHMDKHVSVSKHLNISQPAPLMRVYQPEHERQLAQTNPLIFWGHFTITQMEILHPLRPYFFRTGFPFYPLNL